MSASPAKINVFIYRISEDRNEYQSEMRDSVGDKPIIPIILRGPLFINPNSFLSDLIILLEDNKGLFERQFVFDAEEKRIGILVLTRSELMVARAMSPINLPTWFPVYPGETEHVNIEDITWTAEISLNSVEAHIDEICSYLCELDSLLSKRMLLICKRDHNAGNALLEYFRILINKDVDYGAFLVSANDFNASIKYPAAFRPSIREKKSLISQLWAIVLGCGADQLTKPAKAIGTALGLKKEDIPTIRTSIFSVLNRSSTRSDDLVLDFVRNMIATIFISCQLITAAAHSDSYDRYPMELVKSVSFDLRMSLMSTNNLLRKLE